MPTYTEDTPPSGLSTVTSVSGSQHALVSDSNVLKKITISNLWSSLLALSTVLTDLAARWTAASASGPASLDFREDTDNGTSRIRLIAPSSIASDKTATFQDVTGTIYVSGGTDIPVTDGGTGASDAATARSNLGANVVEYCIALSDETTSIATGTGVVTWRAPRAFTLTAVRTNVNTAPTGATILVDVNVTGTGSILSTRPAIDATEKTSVTGTAAVISSASIADDAEFTFDIDQVGSSVPGKGLKVWLIGTV